MDIFRLVKTLLFSLIVNQLLLILQREYSEMLESEVFIVHLKYKFKLFHIVYPVLKPRLLIKVVQIAQVTIDVQIHLFSL